MSIANSKTEPTTIESASTSSKRLHPEDIHVGDYVTVSRVMHQYPSFLWCGVDTTRLEPEKPVSISYLPHGKLEIYQVKSVCLPFVAVAKGNKDCELIDVRQMELSRVTPEFARTVGKSVGKKRKKKKKN